MKPQHTSIPEASGTFFKVNYLSDVSTGELISELSKRTGVKRFDADKSLRFTAKLPEGATILII